LRLAVLDALRVRDVVALPRELVVLAFPRVRDAVDDALPRVRDAVDDAFPRVRDDVVAFPRVVLLFDLADAFGFVLDPFLVPAAGTFVLPGSLARTVLGWPPRGIQRGSSFPFSGDTRDHSHREPV
jgi:hypothetical protein